MFTAMILICASGMKDPETCFTQVHENYFASHRECRNVIYESVTTYPQLFEFFDESTNTQWKVADWRCVDWKAIRT